MASEGTHAKLVQLATLPRCPSPTFSRGAPSASYKPLPRSSPAAQTKRRQSYAVVVGHATTPLPAPCLIVRHTPGEKPSAAPAGACRRLRWSWLLGGGMPSSIPPSAAAG